jgi:hypothetical protein
MRAPDAWRGVPREPCVACDIAWAIAIALVGTGVVLTVMIVALLAVLS